MDVIAILTVGCCLLLAVCVVVAIYLMLNPMRRMVSAVEELRSKSVESEGPKSIRVDERSVESKALPQFAIETCQAAAEAANILSQIRNSEGRAADFAVAIDPLTRRVDDLSATMNRDYPSLASQIDSLATGDQLKAGLTDAKEWFEKSLTERVANKLTTAIESLGSKLEPTTAELLFEMTKRSAAAVRRDRSFLASSYPRVLAIISADLKDGQWEELSEPTSEGTDQARETEKTKRTIQWKAKMAVLPLCENKNCPTKKPRLDAVRASKGKNNFEYTIEESSLRISPELLASTGVFLIKVALVTVPHAAVLHHFLDMAGISPALVSGIGALVPGLPKDLISDEAKEAAKDYAGDAATLILQQVIETSDGRRSMAFLQREVQNCLARQRVAILNVGGTAHLELGRLMEAEDKKGHVPFGGLVRVLPDDGEYLWVCDHCQREHISRAEFKVSNSGNIKAATQQAATRTAASTP